ncbi:MAG: sigma-70 family RNA polymerase sigma factor [Planctomycetota bacterium]
MGVPTPATLAALHSTARRIVRDDSLAWDVVQDTLVHDRRRGPDAERSVPALRRLCSMIAHSTLRARGRREGYERTACDAHAHREVRDPAVDAERTELASLLSNALQELPSDQRRAFELYELEGHSYACIADQLHVPIGTVRSRIARARAALRSELENRAADYCLELAS